MIFIDKSYSQYNPGGVLGSEVWYAIGTNDIQNSSYVNRSDIGISIINCGSSYISTLFNYNPALYSDQLCLKYATHLENSIGRNFFFVGRRHETNASEIASIWKSPSLNADSINRNYVNLNSNNIRSFDLKNNFQNSNNVSISFYNSTNYNIDRKFQSYGISGESDIIIGAKTSSNHPSGYNDADFQGTFAEFISFPRELSLNEQQRVESYLALKYGITLQVGISYINSQNIVFWNKQNNYLFHHNVFGLGKDSKSQLNQLQSESAHTEKHLIAGVETITTSNTEHTGEIKDNHYLVFGDNGQGPIIGPKNDKNGKGKIGITTNTIYNKKKDE